MAATMADKLVEQLLVSQNRPFNVQLVADLLATKGVKKPTAQRSLDTLATDGKIRVKARSLRRPRCGLDSSVFRALSLACHRCSCTQLVRMFSPEVVCTGVWQSEDLLPQSRRQRAPRRGAAAARATGALRSSLAQRNTA